MMTETELALTILAEECSEVAKACSKALRFGLTHFWEKEGVTNEEAIMIELDDVRFMVKKLVELGVLPDTVSFVGAGFPDRPAKWEATLATSRRLGIVR